MNSDIIILSVNRLYNNYNPETSQKIREDKIKFLQEELSGYTSGQFDKAVRDIIADEHIRKFPTLAQIKAYIPRGETKEGQEFCDKCERTGYYNVWQFKDSIGKHYSFAYRCHCNHTTMQNIPILAAEMIPIRAHNLFPQTDLRRFRFDLEKRSWDYKILDKETFQALVYSHKMKRVLKLVN